MIIQKKNESEASFNIPEKIHLNLLVDIQKLVFGKFIAYGVNGQIILKDQKLMMDQINVRSMKGSVTMSGILDASKKDDFLFSCSADIRNVDIKELFYEFDNFGQNSLIHENLRGKLSADDVLFAMRFDQKLRIDMNSVFAMADITINKGELINYAPMQSLSRFLKVEDLSHITFSSLKNTIEIKNKLIYIPDMEINSSAFKIEASGEHQFDNFINYRIKILLSELLANKAKAAKKENKEFCVIEDDGLGRTSLYVLITGTVDNPVFKYDKKTVKEKIVADFKKEKITLKKVLNKEFGWFKNDSSIKKDTLLKKSDKLIIEWDEEDEK